MGKISEALKKVMEEREKQKQQREELAALRPPQPVLAKPPVAKPLVEQFAKKKPSFQKPLTFRDKLANTKLTLEERLKERERIYLVKPSDDSGIDSRVVSYHDYYSPVSEQYRTLRTNIKSNLKRVASQAKLKITKPAGEPRIVTITSSIQGEGKTVTAVNLAVTLAHDFDARVLLIDCDLRRGSVDKMLNVKHHPGLLDIFAGTAEWPEVFHQTAIKNLLVMPTGKALITPTELLGSKKMRMIIERLKRENFSYIILDTPPLLPFTDAGVLGAQTDGVILIVQSQRTQASALKKTTEFLEQAHARLLGFVLTHADYYTPNFYEHYYYYNQGYRTKKNQPAEQTELVGQE